MTSRKWHLQQNLCVQQILIYLIGLPQYCTHSTGVIAERLDELIVDNRGLLSQVTFDQAAFRNQIGNHISV